MAGDLVLVIGRESPLSDQLRQALERQGCRTRFAEPETAARQLTEDWPALVVTLDSDRLGDTTCLDGVVRSLPLKERPVMLKVPVNPSWEMVAAPPSSTLPYALYAEEIALALLALLAMDQQNHSVANGVFLCDRLRLDRRKYQALWQGQAVDLTVTEFDLLWLLARSPYRVWSRDELVEKLRGVGTKTKARTVDAHIKSLRQKLGPHGSAIQTVRTVGYRYVPDGSH